MHDINPYTKDYFLNECEGYKTFLSSKGLKLSRRLLKIYQKVIELKPKRVLDFGCGRGELALNLGLSWIETYGIDISDDAISISNEIKNYWIKTNPDLKLNFIKIDGKKLPFEDNFFDTVVMSDVIEHLRDDEILEVLSEIRRVLKKNGNILIHTSPNKIFINFGLKIYWIVGFLDGIKLPFNMKDKLPDGLKDKYHINEQTSFSIKRYLKKSGFRNIQIEFWKNPHYVYYFLKDDKYIKKLNFIYKFLPIKHLFFADIFAIGKK
jgi:ubiquinone/menaquinone biosynthesis C-methylase UbiE